MRATCRRGDFLIGPALENQGHDGLIIHQGISPLIWSPHRVVWRPVQTITKTPKALPCIRNETTKSPEQHYPLALFSSEALVGEDDLPVADQVVVAAQQGLGDLAFPELGVGQSPDHRHAFRGADQVQAEAPEVARVRGAVPVAGVPGQVGALDGFAAGAARDRGGIEQAEDFVPGFGVPGQGGDHRTDQCSGGAHALVVSRLLRDPGE